MAYTVLEGATTDAEGNYNWGVNYNTDGANTGSNNSFDFNTIASGVSSIASPLFNFIEGMYAVSQNQPVPHSGGSGTQVVYQTPPQSAGSSNLVMYALAALFLLLLVGLGIYAFKK